MNASDPASKASRSPSPRITITWCLEHLEPLTGKVERRKESRGGVEIRNKKGCERGGEKRRSLDQEEKKRRGREKSNSK